MTALGGGPGFRLNRRGKVPPVFDFTGGVLPAGASLSRASSATRCDAAGTLASEAADVARFDYDPVSHALRGLLVEPAATNQVLNSQDWTQSSWAVKTVTRTATTVIETVGTNAHRMQQAANSHVLAAGAPVVLSCIAGELAGPAKRWLGLYFGPNGFAAAPSATFDLAAGTVTQAANGTAGCIAAPGGWLCWITATPNASVSTGGDQFYLSNDAANAIPSYAGDGASGLAITEMQLETGTLPTSRVRAGASAGSRAADVLTLDWGAKGAADGAIMVRFTFDDGSTQDMAATVSGGLASVPTGLDRPWLRRVEKI